MKCKNPHCKSTVFIPVIKMDKVKRLIGIKCHDCGARYSMDDIEVKKSLKREGWNSVIWTLKHME